MGSGYWSQLNTPFQEMLQIAAELSAPQMQWSHFYDGYGMMVRCDKLGLEIQLAVYPHFRNIVISAATIHARHIGAMKDDFWSTLMELSQFGTAEFNEARERSIVLAVASQYCERLNVEGDVDVFEDFGRLGVKWPIDTPTSEWWPKAAGAFVRLYRLNYMLYRPAYIAANQRKRRSLTRLP